MSVFSVSFIVFSMFFMLSFCNASVQYCLAPHFSHPDYGNGNGNGLLFHMTQPISRKMTNLILFIFRVPNTTVLLFTVKPFCNLSLPLSAKLHLGVLCAWSNTRDDHYPVFRLDIRQHSEFATGYGYPKTAFKREPDTDPDIRNGFIDISRIQTFGKSCTLHNHSRNDYGTIIHSLSSEASFQPFVP